MDRHHHYHHHHCCHSQYLTPARRGSLIRSGVGPRISNYQPSQLCSLTSLCLCLNKLFPPSGGRRRTHPKQGCNRTRKKKKKPKLSSWWSSSLTQDPSYSDNVVRPLTQKQRQPKGQVIHPWLLTELLRKKAFFEWWKGEKGEQGKRKSGVTRLLAAH